MTHEPDSAPPLHSFLARFVGRVVGRFRRAVDVWLRNDGGVLSAAVAYYAALSVLPLLLLAFLAIDAISRNVGFAGDLHAAVLQAVEEEASRQLRLAIEQTLDATRAQNAVGGPLFIGWLTATSILAFAQIDRGIARIWADGDEPEQGSLLKAVLNVVRNRARAVLMLFGLGIVLATMFVTMLVFDTLEHSPRFAILSRPALVRSLQCVIHLVLNTTFFALLMKWFARKPLAWWDALHGAGLLAISWEVGRYVVGTFVVRSHSNLYGVIGSFLVILLWIYYVSILLFFWASYVKCLSDERTDHGSESSVP